MPLRRSTVTRQMANTLTITPYSEESVTWSIAALQQGAPTSGVIDGTPNRARFYPCKVGVRLRLERFFVMVGTAQLGNIDMGLYDRNFVKLTSTGSTPMGVVNTLQWINANPVLLEPEDYYLAIVTNNGASTSFGSTMLAPTSTLGCLQMASAFPLPTNAVPAATLTTRLHTFGFSGRPIA